MLSYSGMELRLDAPPQSDLRVPSWGSSLRAGRELGPNET